VEAAGWWPCWRSAPPWLRGPVSAAPRDRRPPGHRRRRWAAGEARGRVGAVARNSATSVRPRAGLQ
jgi:hypothetical protein